MSLPGQYTSVSRAYDSVVPNKKPQYKRALSTMTELDADYANSLAKLMEVLGSSRVDDLKRNNPQLRNNIDSWENELINANQQHRDKIAFLIQDLKYIAPDLHTDQDMSRKLNEASSTLQTQTSNDIASRISPQKYEEIVADKMAVLYPNYSRQVSTVGPAPVLSSTIVQAMPRSNTPPVVSRSTYEPTTSPNRAFRIDERGNKVYMDVSNISNGQERSPRPSEVRRTTHQVPPNNTSTKYYVIDPVTGEKVERVGDLSPRTTYVPPQQTITYSQPVAQPTVSSQPHPTQYREIRATNGEIIPQALNPSDYQQQLLDPETARMVADAKKDFGNPTAEFIPVSGFPTKIDVARNGQHAIYGGDSIGLIRKQDGWVMDEGILFENKTSTIKHMNNGEILVNNFDNWDLVLLDQSLNEKGKLNGGSRGEPTNYKNINTRTAEDDSNILWLSHPDNLSIVRTNNLSSNEIKNFWRFNGQRSNPVACAISPSGKKLVGISNCNGTFVLHYYDGTDQVVMYKQDDIHPRCSHWESLEIGYDQDMFLLGGRDSKDNAIVLVLTLDDDCNLLTEKNLPNLRSVSTLRRHSQGDIYFAGGYRSISILFYHKRQLHILNDIAVNIDGFVRDLSFHHQTQELYGVSGTDKVFVLDFNHSSKPNRAINRPIPGSRPKRKLGAGLSRNPSQSQLHPGQAQPDARIITSSNVSTRPEARSGPKHTAAFNDYGIKQLTLPDCSSI